MCLCWILIHEYVTQSSRNHFRSRYSSCSNEMSSLERQKCHMTSLGYDFDVLKVSYFFIRFCVLLVLPSCIEGFKSGDSFAWNLREAILVFFSYPDSCFSNDFFSLLSVTAFTLVSYGQVDWWRTELLVKRIEIGWGRARGLVKCLWIPVLWFSVGCWVFQVVDGDGPW